MQTFQLTVTVNEQGNVIIPAPLEKAGARLRLLVVWEEEAPTTTALARGSEEWKNAVLQFQGTWADSLGMTVDEWNKHKHDIWKMPA